MSLKRQFFSDGTFSYKSLVRNRTRNGRVRSASAGLPPFLFHLWLSSQDAHQCPRLVTDCCRLRRSFAIHLLSCLYDLLLMCKFQNALAPICNNSSGRNSDELYTHKMLEAVTDICLFVSSRGGAVKKCGANLFHHIT